MFKFSMNQVVRDTITGYTGVIQARVEYATGCLHYGVLPQKVDKDGKIPSWEYLDEARLVLIHKGKPLKKDNSPGQSPPEMN